MRKYKWIISFIFIVLTFALYNDVFVRAEVSSKDVEYKGFYVSGFDFIDGKMTKTLNIDSSYGNNYGRMTMWMANYMYVTKDSNGNDSAYFLILIEASIDSNGKIGSNYYRNKVLEIKYKTKIWGCSTFDLIKCTESTTNSTINRTQGFSVSGGVSGGYKEAAISAGLSYSCSSSISTDVVNLTVSSDDSTGWNQTNFKFSFLDWKDGAMVSPNIGKVTAQVYLLYKASNYRGYVAWNADCDVSATIFKDAKSPKSNGTVTYTNRFTSVEGMFL